MNAAIADRPTTAVDIAWWGVVTRFLVHGLVTATWVSRIPAIQTRLHLSNGALGLSLLGTAVGSVAAIPGAGVLVSRFGSRRMTKWTSAGFCLALALPALAVNAISLFAALVIYGAMAGANDVAMNAHAVAVERAREKPTMSRFHAMFSLGGIAGAICGGVVASRHVSPLEHLLPAAAVLLAFSYGTAGFLTEAEPAAARHSPGLSLRCLPRTLLLLCIIGFCIFLSEGAMADWTAVYLHQVLLAGPGIAAAGYAAFSAGMTTFRLLGDAITERLGRVRTIYVCALVAAAGLSWALLMQSPWWSLLGFAATGVGFSVIIPSVFAEGGRIPSVHPGTGVATVSGTGYLGFLVGPPLIGVVSQFTSLRFGLGVVVLLSFGAAALTRLLEPDVLRLGLSEDRDVAVGVFP